MNDREEPSSGVRELIERVRSEGVEAGADEARRIVDEAHARAAQIVEAARAEAERLTSEAKEQQRIEEEGGRAALARAARDTILKLEEELTGAFGRQLRQRIEEQLADPDVLRQLIVELVGAERPATDEPVEILLPDRAVQIDELRKASPELGENPLDGVVLSLARDALREGVTVRTSGSEPGLRLRLDDGHVEVEVTTEALAELLEQHLLPRFRGLLEGVYR